MTEKELLQKKKQIEQAKTELAELTGQQKQLFKQLKTDFGLDSLKDAEIYLEHLTKEQDELLEEVNKLTEKLENEHFAEN